MFIAKRLRSIYKVSVQDNIYIFCVSCQANEQFVNFYKSLVIIVFIYNHSVNPVDEFWDTHV